MANKNLLDLNINVESLNKCQTIDFFKWKIYIKNIIKYWNNDLVRLHKILDKASIRQTYIKDNINMIENHLIKCINILDLINKCDPFNNLLDLIHIFKRKQLYLMTEYFCSFY